MSQDTAKISFSTAVELVMNELGINDADARAWVREHILATPRPMTRRAVLNAIASQRRARTIWRYDDEKQDPGPELSL